MEEIRIAGVGMNEQLVITEESRGGKCPSW